MLEYIYIAIGSAFGGMLRYFCSTIISNSLIYANFPLGVLVINIAGSFIIGLASSISIADPLIEARIKYLIIIGFCGGYTTFSSFSLDNLHLIQNNQVAVAVVNILSSVILCIVATWVGYVLGKYIT